MQQVLTVLGHQDYHKHVHFLYYQYILEVSCINKTQVCHYKPLLRTSMQVTQCTLHAHILVPETFRRLHKNIVLIIIHPTSVIMMTIASTTDSTVVLIFTIINNEINHM